MAIPLTAPIGIDKVDSWCIPGDIVRLSKKGRERYSQCVNSIGVLVTRSEDYNRFHEPGWWVQGIECSPIVMPAENKKVYFYYYEENELELVPDDLCKQLVRMQCWEKNLTT